MGSKGAGQPKTAGRPARGANYPIDFTRSLMALMARSVMPCVVAIKPREDDNPLLSRGAPLNWASPSRELRARVRGPQDAKKERRARTPPAIEIAPLEITRPPR